MTFFATEFPCIPAANSGAFVARLRVWLRGVSASRLFEEDTLSDIDGPSAQLLSESGEMLSVRQLSDAGEWRSIGFRHELPDDEGRIWRTDGVLRRTTSHDEGDVLRIRTQCLAAGSIAQLVVPRKPYIIKTLIEDGLAAVDGHIQVSDQAHMPSDSAASLDLAKAAIDGTASRFLPIVYISCPLSEHGEAFDDRTIKRLALDLGGIAHVIVEPSRAFSIKLRERMEGRNVFGGSVGVSLPGEGVVRRFFLGWRFSDAPALAREVSRYVVQMRSRMGARIGWDWSELQEACLRAERAESRKAEKPDEVERAYEDELTAKAEKIRELERMLSIAQSGAGESVSDIPEGLLEPTLVKCLGRELFQGEFSARVLHALSETLRNAERDGLDTRSKVVLRRIVSEAPRSEAVRELRSGLKKAVQSSPTAATRVARLLENYGFTVKSEKKHIRLEPEADLEGLATLTLPKTPGDHRSFQNNVAQIARTLGLNKLSG